MTLVSRQIPALFNGVSQQPATLRQDSQGEEQINAFGTVVEGLVKRPPFQHVAKVSDASLDGAAHIHNINRDVTERYSVVITDGDLKVFDINGVEQVVAFPIGKGYLVNSSPVNGFSVVSIADYSFIINKSVTVATKTAETSVPGYTTTAYYPVNWRNAGSSPYFNVAQGSFKGTKQLFEDLPKPGGVGGPVEGDTWKIAGYDQNSFGVFYVVYRGGVWEETHEPGKSVTLDENTMPHALVRKSDGTFEFTQFAWNARKYGDDTSNPPPTFVGRVLRDCFYYKNRLGFVSDENVVFSTAGDFGNFWRNTVTDLLDSDVIDVAVSNTKVSVLNFAVPFNNNMMLFSDQTQFSLNVDELLTPTTVSIDTVTDYEMNTDARPVAIGNDVYFVTETSTSSRVREYFVQDDKNTTEAADVTAHVPKYLPKGISQLVGNSNEDILFAISPNEPNRLYVYKFFWINQEKAQSAWSYWELEADAKILSIADLESSLYALIERADGVYLERMDLQFGAVTGSLEFDILLDRRTSVTGTYFAGGDYTEFSVPYDVDPSVQANFRIVKGDDFTGEVGRLIDPQTYSWTLPGSVRVPGDQTAGEVWVGANYEMRYQFSEQFMKNDDRAITTGRLMMRTWTLYYTDTAYFKTEVSPYGSAAEAEQVIPAQLSEFTGKTIGDLSTVLGVPNFHTGSYSFQIYGDSTLATVAIVNDSHVQSRIQSAEWEALYHNRARSL